MKGTPYTMATDALDARPNSLLLLLFVYEGHFIHHDRGNRISKLPDERASK